MMLWEASVLLREAVQRGLFGAVALVLNRGAMRRPLGLPADRFRARRSKWWTRTASSLALRLNRPGCRVTIRALRSGPPRDACMGVRQAASGWRDRGHGRLFRVGSTHRCEADEWQ